MLNKTNSEFNPVLAEQELAMIQQECPNITEHFYSHAWLRDNPTSWNFRPHAAELICRELITSKLWMRKHSEDVEKIFDYVNKTWLREWVHTHSVNDFYCDVWSARFPTRVLKLFSYDQLNHQKIRRGYFLERSESSLLEYLINIYDTKSIFILLRRANPSCTQLKLSKTLLNKCRRILDEDGSIEPCGKRLSLMKIVYKTMEKRYHRIVDYQTLLRKKVNCILLRDLGDIIMRYLVNVVV